MYDVIVIGAGPAGMTASIYATRKGLVTLVVGTDIGGQVSKSGEIENYLGFGAQTGAELSQAFYQHVKKFSNIEHLHGVTVTNIEKKKTSFTVQTKEKIFEGTALIIASGRFPKRLHVPGEKEFENKGVSYCDVCDGPLFAGKIVTIVGGGNSALEAALLLATKSPYVYIVTIDETLSGDEILKRRVESNKKIKVIYHGKTTAIKGDTFVKKLVYEDKDGVSHTIDTEGVFIEIGWIPSVEFDHLTKKDEYNRIIVDVNSATSIPGIFAAGDVTNIRDNQIIIAAGEGAKAALSAYTYVAHK